MARPGVDLLTRAVSRTPLAGHDGRSGASLERVVLDDGTRLIVKTATPANDLAAAAVGGPPDRELRLFASGRLDGLPAGLGHAIVDTWWDDDRVVTVMRDLGDSVGSWSSRLSRGDCRRVLEAAAALHRHFADDLPKDLCALEDRLALLGPATMARLADDDNPLPAAVLRGWEVFEDLVPDDVRQAVAAVHADAAILAGPLRASSPTTLVHGDLWMVNLALEPEQVVLLDWGLATAAPPVVDFGSFLAGNASLVAASREEIIADFRAAEGDAVSDAALRLGLLFGLVELGWNKALDAADHADPEVRRRERADLDWWVAAARPAVERDL